MKKILEYSDYIEAFDLDAPTQAEIRDWVKKYEKYFNFHNDGTFLDSIDKLTDDCMNQLNIDKSKSDAVKSYIEGLQDLSDGLSVVMAPNAEFQYNDIDQVQRFQY